MQLKRVYIIIVLMQTFIAATAQWNAIGSMAVKAEKMAVDVLGNIYLVNENKLVKYDKDLKMLHTYNLMTKGNISSIDVSDPFKVLVFYQDFSHIAWLDNTLSPSFPDLPLAEMNYPLVTAVSHTQNNNIWIFDQTSLTLKRLDNKLQIINESSPINTMTDVMPDISIINETANYLFAYNNNDRLLIFDRFGALYRYIPVNALIDFHYEAPLLFMFTKDKLRVFNMKSLHEDVYDLPADDIISASMARNTVYLLTHNSLKIYTLRK